MSLLVGGRFANVHAAPSKNFKSKRPKETALESLRHYVVYEQLVEGYQFFRCHSRLATIMISIGVCLQLASVFYYSCFYLNYLCNMYTTVVPNLMTLLNFKDVNLHHFKPPYNIFIFCTENLITCFLGAVCTSMCFYLVLPMKGRYLATIRKQHSRRQNYCIALSFVIGVSICYQIVLSLMKNIMYATMVGGQKADHVTLLSADRLSETMKSQGLTSFWSLHAYQHVPCCPVSGFNLLNDSGTPPAECCLAYGLGKHQTQQCIEFKSSVHLWPNCLDVFINIASDIEVTINCQMQLFLTISCLVAFVLKFGLYPHLHMQCPECQSTYGWVNMARRDN